MSQSYTENVKSSSGYSATDAELKTFSQSICANNYGYYQQDLELVNVIRADVGVHALELDSTLCLAATMRSVEMDLAILGSVIVMAIGHSCLCKKRYITGYT